MNKNELRDMSYLINAIQEAVESLTLKELRLLWAFVQGLAPEEG